MPSCRTCNATLYAGANFRRRFGGSYEHKSWKDCFAYVTGRMHELENRILRLEYGLDRTRTSKETP